jgi:hypothetical protein
MKFSGSRIKSGISAALRGVFATLGGFAIRVDGTVGGRYNGVGERGPFER